MVAASPDMNNKNTQLQKDCSGLTFKGAQGYSSGQLGSVRRGGRAHPPGRRASAESSSPKGPTDADPLLQDEALKHTGCSWKSMLEF